MHDIIIIGAGPAGMAAAVLASGHGADVLLLDEGRSPGGQIYRAIEHPGNPQRPELGISYARGAGLARALRDSAVRYVPGASVWHLAPDLQVGYSADGAARMVSGHQIILANGAMERPMPVRGWTLPGVMTAGAAQILLKETGLAIPGAVFAGTGPLLYLIVQQYLHAGIPVKAVIDLTPPGNHLKALAHLPGILPSLSRVWEGWQWQRRIARSETKFVRGARDIRITGDTAVTGFEYRKGGRWHRIDCENVFLHQGVVPNLNLALSAGCASNWNTRQAAWNITVDDWCSTNIPGLRIAGDGAAIGGAIAAENQGGITALGALRALGRIDVPTRDRLARPYRKLLKREMVARPFLETLFRPADTMRIPQDDDVQVCRCEEITAADIRQLARDGLTRPNQIKSFSRCGMGPCQGRNCGLTVSEMLADFTGTEVADVGHFRLRSPVKPLPLKELARLEIEVST